MLTPEARRLLKIPQDAALPVSLPELYDGWFSGRSYQTRFRDGWTFAPRGVSQDGSYDLCLDHDTAQFWFGLDPAFRVCVRCQNWIPIATSFVSLVETDALLSASRARQDKVRGMGRFPGHDEFLAHHADYLRGFQDVSLDPSFTRILQGSESLVVSFRFYSDEPTITTAEYYY